MSHGTVVPEGFKVSNTIKSELPDAEVEGIAEYLWSKSAGRCALCDHPLPADGRSVDTDHVVARKEGEGGETVRKNLYLAHRECNRSRKNLPYDLAVPIITFQRWCRAGRRDFDEVVAKYLPSGRQRVSFEDNGETFHLALGSMDVRAPVFVDPATGTRYFFADVPVEYIQNDTKSQPRMIEHDHVRTLAEDFAKHPVHEPSNCRLVPVKGTGVADLLQFDGQHKTTAQIVLGRSTVPMKFYIDPDEAMIQELVVQIQQGIKKRPLSTTDTLRKLDDVVRAAVTKYQSEHDGRYPSEKQLWESQPLQEQTKMKTRLLSNIEFAVLNDDSLELRQYASKKADKKHPLTDTVLVKRMIHPLVSQVLLEEPLDNAVQRDTERRIVVDLLNRIEERMLRNRWKPRDDASDDLHTLRARNFFYQGSIGWWMNELLLPAMRAQFSKAVHANMFLEDPADEKLERIYEYIDAICSWDIWSTQESSQLAAMRSNTVKNVAAAFPDYTLSRLIQDAGA